MRITSCADRVAGTRPAGRRTARRSRKPSARARERRVLEGGCRRPAAATSSAAPMPSRSLRRRRATRRCVARSSKPQPASSDAANIVEDDQPRVVARVEDRQAADDLEERRDAQHHGEPQEAEQRHRDPLGLGPQDERRRGEHQRQRAHVERALEHEQPDRRLRRPAPPVRQEDARSPPCASSAMSTECPPRSWRSAECSSSSANGTRLTAASAAPPSDGRRRRPATRAAPAAASGVPARRACQSRRTRNAAAAMQRVEARLGVAGQELERHDGGQPGAGQQARAAHERGR